MQKKQGQSTTEYLLVVLLASVFVGVLALQFSPGFKRVVERLEDRVAAAIAGGRLLTHPPRVAEESSSPPVAGQWQTAQATKAPQQEPAAGGDAGASQVPAGGAREGESGFLGGTGSTAVGGGTARGGIQRPIEEAQTDAVVAKIPAVPDQTAAPEKSEAKAPEPTKEEDAFSKKGIQFGAGQENDVVGKDRFNWMRLLLILLIALLVIYIIFEIVKALKLSRSGKYK